MIHDLALKFGDSRDGLALIRYITSGIPTGGLDDALHWGPQNLTNIL